MSGFLRFFLWDFHKSGVPFSYGSQTCSKLLAVIIEPRERNAFRNFCCFFASLVAQMVKNLPAMQETQVRSLGQEALWRREWQPTHSSILAWRIPRTEEPGGQKSMGSQKVRYDWTTNTFTYHSYVFSFSFFLVIIA